MALLMDWPGMIRLSALGGRHPARPADCKPLTLQGVKRRQLPYGSAGPRPGPGPAWQQAQQRSGSPRLARTESPAVYFLVEGTSGILPP